MQEAITIDIPGEPVPKGRPRFSAHAGYVQTFTPAKTEKYERLVRSYACAAMMGNPLLAGPVYVKVYCLLPIPKSWTKARRAAALSGQLLPTGKPDQDNLAKSVLDALNGIVFADDSQVTDSYTKKRYAEQPCVRVIVQPLPGLCSHQKLNQETQPHGHKQKTDRDDERREAGDSLPPRPGGVGALQRHGVQGQLPIV